MEGLPVVLSDTQTLPDEHELSARVPAAKYSEICETLGCKPGEVAETLLHRVSEQTADRFYTQCVLYLREVRAAGKLGTLATMLADGGALADLRKA